MVAKHGVGAKLDVGLENGKKDKDLYVVKVKRIPYGFFEKQLWEYFTQFGKVVRVRVSRSLKTGNFKGWAYVGFADKEVAEIAAETMNGYLMFEKRLSCRLMDPNKVPRSMKSGPRYVAPPHMRARAKKEASRRNKSKTAALEERAKARREVAHKRRLSKLKALGINYDCDGLFPSKAVVNDHSGLKGVSFCQAILVTGKSLPTPETSKKMKGKGKKMPKTIKQLHG